MTWKGTLASAGGGGRRPAAPTGPTKAHLREQCITDLVFICRTSPTVFSDTSDSKVAEALRRGQYGAAAAAVIRSEIRSRGDTKAVYAQLAAEVRDLRRSVEKASKATLARAGRASRQAARARRKSARGKGRSAGTEQPPTPAVRCDMVGPGIAPCPSCAKRNRISQPGRHRCGSCSTEFTVEFLDSGR